MSGPRSEPVIGVWDERIGPDELRAARALTHILDTAVTVPGTKIRFGLDPILGLIPGLGDLAGAALSGYVVLLASRFGAPGSVIARMVGNVAIDSLVGAVPLLGDLFDAAWKANRRNLSLLERYLDAPSRTKRSSTMVLVGALLVLAAIAVGAVALTVWGVSLILGALG